MSRVELEGKIIEAITEQVGQEAAIRLGQSPMFREALNDLLYEIQQED